MEATERDSIEGDGTILRRAEWLCAGSTVGARVCELRNPATLCPEPHRDSINTESNRSNRSSRCRDDPVVRASRGHERRRAQDGHGRPTMPYPDGTGSFQPIQEDQLSDKGWEAACRHREENVTCRTSQAGRSEEGGQPGSKRAEVTGSLAVEIGSQGHTTLVLGGEWAMGPFAQPRVHANLGRTTYSKLLHVQSPNWDARGIPSTKDNWDMDQHSSQPEDMPSFWMAQESPINHRRIS